MKFAAQNQQSDNGSGGIIENQPLVGIDIGHHIQLALT